MHRSLLLLLSLAVYGAAQTTTTTTTTVTPTTTTTRRPDPVLLPTQLIPLTVYYNFNRGLHAFCSTTACLDEIQKNGIGYERNWGRYHLGRVVSNDAATVTAAQTLCPGGWPQMRLLGFTRSGLAYEHNLTGAGLVQGYVSTTANACGATVPIKKWKSRFNDDIIYGTNLEWNIWYAGMVQDGGRPQFYMWP